MPFEDSVKKLDDLSTLTKAAIDQCVTYAKGFNQALNTDASVLGLLTGLDLTTQTKADINNLYYNELEKVRSKFARRLKALKKTQSPSDDLVRSVFDL